MIIEKKDFDALAERIRAGIEKHGSYALREKDLEILWSEQILLSEEEKRLVLQNFSMHYGFFVQPGPRLATAIFSNQL